MVLRVRRTHLVEGALVVAREIHPTVVSDSRPRPRSRSQQVGAPKGITRRQSGLVPKELGAVGIIGRDDRTVVDVHVVEAELQLEGQEADRYDIARDLRAEGLPPRKTALVDVVRIVAVRASWILDWARTHAGGRLW